MINNDLFFVFSWWSLIFILGLFFLPLTFLLFKNFFDKGYIFSKLIAILSVSYISWLLSSLKILPFNQVTILVITILLFIANLIALGFVFYNKDCLEIDFLDVGQGDAIFIETSLGNQILIDGGKDNSILYNLEKEMSFYDKDIDLVILTHADKDHFGGLMNVFEVYKVDNFIWNGADSESKDFIKFKEQFNSTNVLEVKKGDKVLFTKYGPNEIKVEDKTYLIASQDDVLAILE